MCVTYRERLLKGIQIYQIGRVSRDKFSSHENLQGRLATSALTGDVVGICRRGHEAHSSAHEATRTRHGVRDATLPTADGQTNRQVTCIARERCMVRT